MTLKCIFWTIVRKDYFFEMESFSNFLLGRNEFREFEVFPTPDCGNQPERLHPTENLALPLPFAPQRGLGTVQKHLAHFSGAILLISIGSHR